MLKIAIIGCGRIFNKHFEAISSLKRIYRIVGIYDRDKKKK